MNEEFLGGFILACAIIFMVIEFIFGHTLIAGVLAAICGVTFGAICYVTSKRHGADR